MNKTAQEASKVLAEESFHTCNWLAVSWALAFLMVGERESSLGEHSSKLGN